MRNSSTTWRPSRWRRSSISSRRNGTACLESWTLRAVLQADAVPGLRDVGEQRVVAGILPVMGIEAPERPDARVGPS
jgi:hypothetical protein